MKVKSSGNDAHLYIELRTTYDDTGQSSDGGGMAKALVKKSREKGLISKFERIEV